MNLKKGRTAYDAAKLSKLGNEVGQAKAEISGLGTKGGKNKKPRNRVMAGEFVANSYALGGGAYRATTSAFELLDLIGDVELLAGSGLKPTQINAGVPVARFVKGYLPILELTLQEYTRSLQAAAGAVPRIKRFPNAASVAQQLTIAAKQIDVGMKRGTDVARKKDVDGLYQRLLAASKGTQ